MEKNVLFGLINYLITNKSEQLFEDRGTLTLSVTKEGKRYYRLDFSGMQTFAPYKLTNVHLSIYENYSPAIPKYLGKSYIVFRSYICQYVI